MRICRIMLLLLTALATAAYPQVDERFFRHAEVPAVAGKALASDTDQWRYSRLAPFHGVLGADTQEFASTDPEETAGQVCAELGGEVGFVAPASADEMRLGFLCRFAEPDMTMSIDFGELDRIPAR